MKKFPLGLLLVIILLIVLGGGLIAWANTTHRRIDVTNFTAKSLATKTISLADNPRQLTFDLRTAVLVIQPGSTTTLTLDHVTADQFQIDYSNDSLTVNQKDAQQHHLEIGKSAVLTLTVAHPTTLKALTITQLNGTLKLNGLTVNRLAIDHTNGTTLANHLTVTGNGQLTKKNGATTLNDLTTDGLHVAVKTGQFKLNGAKKAGSGQSYHELGQHPLTISSGSGQVQITQ
ncbi:DUF4097 family beta strand repeat-containing protein [Levilactobacillus koreensis]|uniref:DUF4097 domain-containing protein n=1 Tax=Levilactobacillus koreensis TaxID=637971 RepID=A0AAC8UVE1_9LACO|nr:DUF4097 family beta strand repeat-containing protein [Levilactobacillus koreensis]AKP64312.1 hypothetical protein ABN16_04425 [Levilactobacillus koreensis]